MSNPEPISASRVKTLYNCSYLFYVEYILKLKGESNDGARRGNVCHSLFEPLLNERHRKLYDCVVENGSISFCPAIKRFVLWKMAKEGLVNEFDNKGNNNYELIDSMIQVGLRNNFFLEGETLEKPEHEFRLKNKSPKYEIRGFIDKLSTYINENGEKVAHIVDYKTSQYKFTPKELDFNIQGLMYALYIWKKWGLRSKVDFIFLRFPDDPVQTLEYTPEDLEGFEDYLEHVQEKMNNFSLRDARLNLAANKGYPDKEEGFCKRAMCGRGNVEGQLKNDGTPYWSCPFKYPFEYYQLVNRQGQLIESSKDRRELEGKVKKGWLIRDAAFPGCPAFNVV